MPGASRDAGEVIDAACTRQGRHAERAVPLVEHDVPLAPAARLAAHLDRLVAQPRMDDGIGREAESVAAKLQAPAEIRVLASEKRFVEAAKRFEDPSFDGDLAAAGKREIRWILVLLESVALRRPATGFRL